MAEECRITMDTKIDKPMLVRVKEKIIRFGQMCNRLCGLDTKMSNKCIPEQCHNMFSNNEEEPNDKNSSLNNNMMHHA